MINPKDKMLELDRICNQLGEHFTSVIILASGSADDGTGATCMFKSQSGNTHAQEGLVREWLRERDAYETGFHMEEGRRDYIRIEGDA